MKKETNEQQPTPAKEVLTAREAAAYMDISLSYLYRLTMDRAIPFYKPNGKRIYFKRGEVENWLTSIRCDTNADIAAQAQAYTYTKGKGGAR